jgi:glycine dehydrogenase subunit 1
MRYIPHTTDEIKHMLKTVGVDDVGKLFDSIPSDLKLSEPLNLPEAMDEESLNRHLGKLSNKNTASANITTSFLGAGAYNHHIPAVINQLLLRSEFFTAYTPYQPEASQGTLQAIFEYQSMMASLIGCEVVNASMYDGASATAEALLMAGRIKKKKTRILIAHNVHPEVRAVCQTYLSDNRSTIEIINSSPNGQTDLEDLTQKLDQDVAAVVIQQPNAFGCLEDLPRIADQVHQADSLLIGVVLEPVSLGLLEAPGKLGADIVCGEGMSLGTGLNYGGPGLGIFGSSQKNTWQMPGRLVGQTTDVRGQKAYVLTMSTREQHIRRARATSNICTNEGLCALATVIYLSLMGRQGFEELARTNAANARYACQRLTSIPGVSQTFPTPFFNEFAISLEQDAELVHEKLSQQGMIAGFPLGKHYPEHKNSLLVCLTETNTKEQVEQLASALES